MRASEAFETIDRIIGVLEAAKAVVVAKDLKEARGVIRGRLQELAREKLLSRMEEISEEAYCAGWMMYLEHNLWRIANSQGPYHFGQEQYTREQMDELLALARDAGGWWHWNESPDVDDTEFVPMADWLKMYKGASK